MFKTTSNKDFIRENIDKQNITNYSKKKGQRLKYIGLPGEDLLDIGCWKDFLGNIYAVEVGDSKNPDGMLSRMYLNAIELGVMDRFFILEGDLDDILITGKDIFGNKLIFPFDIANFDYCGSVIYSGFKRVESIKQFIGNQKNQDFLLLHSSRIKQITELEIIKAIETIKLDLLDTHSDSESKKNIEEYFKKLTENEEDIYKFFREKLFNLYFIKLYAESKGYKVDFLEPIIYKGHKEHLLMRFTTFFSFTGETTTKVISPQSILDLIRMPITNLSEGAKLMKIPNPLGKLNL